MDKRLDVCRTVSDGKPGNFAISAMKHTYRLRSHDGSHVLHDPHGDVVLVLMNLGRKKADMVCDCFQEAYDLGRTKGSER